MFEIRILRYNGFLSLFIVLFVVLIVSNVSASNQIFNDLIIVEKPIKEKYQLDKDGSASLSITLTLIGSNLSAIEMPRNYLLPMYVKIGWIPSNKSTDWNSQQCCFEEQSLPPSSSLEGISNPATFLFEVELVNNPENGLIRAARTDSPDYVGGYKNYTTTLKIKINRTGEFHVSLAVALAVRPFPDQNPDIYSIECCGYKVYENVDIVDSSSQTEWIFYVLIFCAILLLFYYFKTGRKKGQEYDKDINSLQIDEINLPQNPEGNLSDMQESNSEESYDIGDT